MSINISDNVIDAREIIDLLHDVRYDLSDLNDQLTDAHEARNFETAEELREQIEQLESENQVWFDLEAELKDESDWPHGLQLIAADYFVEYAQQLAEDLGYVKHNVHWPYTHIDWDAAADDLKQDYCSVTVTDNRREYDFWFRS